MLPELKTAKGHRYEIIEVNEFATEKFASLVTKLGKVVYAGCTNCGWNLDAYESITREVFNDHLKRVN